MFSSNFQNFRLIYSISLGENLFISVGDNKFPMGKITMGVYFSNEFPRAFFFAILFSLFVFVCPTTGKLRLRSMFRNV